MMLKNYRHEMFICLAMFFITLFVYGRVIQFGFINYDDRAYVTEKKHVRTGLTPENLEWAFTNHESGHWHPLTWMSHMLDCQLFGLDAGKHHRTSLMWHLLNVILVFLILRRMTGATYRSAIAAMVFALHPMNVEAVAAISSRKDVLSGFFWLLTLFFYVRYTERQSWHRFLAVLVCFLFGLTAKAVLITLPVILLLIDYWPLNRLWNTKRSDSDTKRPILSDLNIKPLIEKGVLLIPAIAVSLAAVVFMQLRNRELPDLTSVLPGWYAFANSLLNYVHYLSKMIRPSGLVVPYPYRDMPPVWQTLGALVILGVISATVFRLRKKYPYAWMGWLWYVIAFLPMIGLIAIGPKAAADRYAYLPTLGLVVIMVWGGYDLSLKFGVYKETLSIVVGIFLLILSGLSFRQVGFWRNSITLFERAVRLTDKNPVAHYCLGFSLESTGRMEDAAREYQAALKDSPGYVEAHNNLGGVLFRLGRVEEARTHFEKAFSYDPESVVVMVNLGNILGLTGHPQKALFYYRKALEKSPNHELALVNMGQVYLNLRKTDEAMTLFERVLKNNPRSIPGHYLLGLSLQNQKKYQAAAEHYKKVVAMSPGMEQARRNLAFVLSKLQEARKLKLQQPQ